MAKKGSTKSSKKSEVVVATPAVLPEEKSIVESKDAPILTEQQALFLNYYYDSESPTWYNAKQSAIKAGFGENYACQITYRKPDWWLDMVRRSPLIGKIEQHFDEVMNLPNVTQAMGAFGPIFTKEKVREQVGYFKNGKPKFKVKTIKTPVYVANTQIIKAKNEVSKIAAPAHDPDRYGKKAGNNNKFVFNMAVVKERYKT